MQQKSDSFGKMCWTFYEFVGPIPADNNDVTGAIYHTDLYCSWYALCYIWGALVFSSQTVFDKILTTQQYVESLCYVRIFTVQILVAQKKINSAVSGWRFYSKSIADDIIVSVIELQVFRLIQFHCYFILNIQYVVMIIKGMLHY